MNKIDFEKWKKADLERSSPYIKRPNLTNIEKTKKIISERIKEIIKKLGLNTKVLIINCTWYENLLLEETLIENNCSVEAIKKSNLEELIINIDSLIKKKI